MLFHSHPPSMLVRSYTSTRDLEREARRLAKKGYRIAGQSAHTSIGFPTLSHGILHTRYTVTYALHGANTVLAA